MKLLALVLSLSSILSACGTAENSNVNAWGDKDSKHKPGLKLVCEIKVNQFTNGLISGEVTAKVSSTKSFKDIQAAYADATELASVVSAADRKCTADGFTKINTSACSQIANVNTGNVGRYNTFSLNNGLSTGFYQCNAQ